MTGVDGILIPAHHQPLLGKNVDDLIGKDVKVAEDGSVSGTLLYVPSYPDFSSNADEQHGNYFPAYIDREGEQITIDKDGAVKTHDFPDDHLLVIRVDKQETTVKITVDESEITTLNFKKAKLKEATQ